MGSILKKPSSKKGRPPTEEDLRFVEEYLRTGNAQGAYEKVFPGRNSPGTNAMRKLKRASIQALLHKANDRVVKRLEKKLEITVEKVLEDIEEARLTALNAHPSPQCAAAIKASELHGRHIGMFREEFHDQAQAPIIMIKTLGGAQIAVIGKDQGAISAPPALPNFISQDVDEVLTVDDLL